MMYIHTSREDQPELLKKYAGQWRRIEDVRREAASRQPPAESKVDLGAEPAGRNDQSSPGIQHHVGDEHDVAKPDTLARDRPLPNEPTSALPAATTPGEDGTAKPGAVSANPIMGTTKPAASLELRAQLDAKAGPSKLGSPLQIGEMAGHRKSAEREPVALEDVLREEAASPLPPAETEIDRGAEPAGPNDQTTSQRTQNNGDDEDHVPMVDNVAADPSPADEPTLAPTLPTATDEEGTTKPELVAADPTMDEATEPKAKITSPGSTRSKQGRSGGRQLKKQKLPAEISERGRKCSPTRMRLFLDSIAECPIKTQAAKKAGVHRRTPDYWLKSSAAGHDGFEIDWRGSTAKFHEHFNSAMDEGEDLVREIARRMATGYDETLTYQGRVTYKTDWYLWSLGRRGPDAYLKDENGNPIPETIRKVDPKMIRYLLPRLRSTVYGWDRTVDVPRQGGVLVIGGPVKTEKFEEEFDAEDGSEGEE